MKRYAEHTDVPVVKSRAEIERLLSQHKCSQFSSGVDHEHHVARVQFKAYNRIVRFEIALPTATDKSIKYDRRGYSRTPSALDTALAQADRQRWRALLLVIKAKLESVENAIASFEEEFLAHIVLPDNRTVGEYVLPAIERMYATNRMLPAPATAIDVDREEDAAS